MGCKKETTTGDVKQKKMKQHNDNSSGPAVNEVYNTVEARFILERVNKLKCLKITIPYSVACASHICTHTFQNFRLNSYEHMPRYIDTIFYTFARYEKCNVNLNNMQKLLPFENN